MRISRTGSNHSPKTMMPNDPTWAVTLSESVYEPLTLPHLNELICYTDETGELAKILGDKATPGRTYPGASAISQLGRGVPSSAGNQRAPTGRGDKVEDFYYSLTATPISIVEMSDLDEGSPYMALRTYDRYWGTEGFPGELPSESDLKRLLGINGQDLEEKRLLRSAIGFYMHLYADMALSARDWLATRILHCIDQYRALSDCPRSLRAWWQNRNDLFGKDSAAVMAKEYRRLPEQSFALFANEAGIPQHTSLFTAIRLEALCEELRSLPHQPLAVHQELLERLVMDKDKRIDQKWTVGAKALQLLVDRSIDELGGMPPDSWGDLIVDLGCHPDRKLSGQLFERYWFWAKSEQLDAGRMAFIRRDLEVIFEYLKNAAKSGQMGGHMVGPRVELYKKMLRKGLIRDSRLFLGTNVHRRLRFSLKRKQFWDLHEAGDKDLCILALKLADGVNLTTGTKSFPMRFYPSSSREFRELWDGFNPRREQPVFYRNHFMHNSPICIRKTHQGNWKASVINEILTDTFLGRVDWSHHDLI